MEALDKQGAIKVAKPYFEAYPKQDTLYVSEDGAVFLNENLAANHARGAKCAVIPVSRQDKAEDNAPSKEDQLRAFDLSDDCDWNELRKLGSLFDVEAKDKEGHLNELRAIKEKLEKED